MIVEQITRERRRQACGGAGCGTVVQHVQVAGYPNGFRVYEWIPIAHRRPDGVRCLHMHREREAVWQIRGGR